MQQLAEELTSVVERAAEALRAVGDTEAGQSYRPGGWSRKELLGHLIDSASNNHQRFVRAQGVPFLEFPKYEQEEWVGRQNYRQESWPDLVELWRLYNRHLAHVIRAFPAEKLEVGCKVGPSEPMKIGDVIKDYLRHLKHHLSQLGLQGMAGMR
ncbi:MAG: DinB family protein [Acidobacteria bacterium]|nr:MAG: DinB family protein [Acidobacteriota bacterium]